MVAEQPAWDCVKLLAIILVLAVAKLLVGMIASSVVKLLVIKIVG